MGARSNLDLHYALKEVQHELDIHKGISCSGFSIR